MYKLWRREAAAKPATPDVNARKKEAAFSQAIATLIKFCKKKEEFYLRAMSKVGSFRPPCSADGPERETMALKLAKLHDQFSGLSMEEEELVTGLKSFQKQPFFLSKSFLYTAFVRLLELYEYTRQRLMLRQKNGEEIEVNNSWDRLLEEGRTSLTDCYQNLIYFQNYNVQEMLSLALSKQNQRIHSVVPPKNRKTQVTLKPIAKINPTELKKSPSIELKPASKDRRLDLVEKKLVKKENNRIMLTEKRLEERKKSKKLPITFKSLYGVMGIKPVKVEQNLTLRRQLETDVLERNALIIEERKKWEKQYEKKNYSMKFLRRVQGGLGEQDGLRKVQGGLEKQDGLRKVQDGLGEQDGLRKVQGGLG